MKNKFKKVTEYEFQLLLKLILKSHYLTYDEVPIGNGRVDFLVFRNIDQRVIIETKLSTNKNWNKGILKQLPDYLNMDKVTHGIYVLFYMPKTKTPFEEVKEILIKQLKSVKKYKIDLILIDMRPKSVPSGH